VKPSALGGWSSTDRFDNLSLSPKGNDSGIVFIGMVHNGSLSLHTILKESTDKVDTISSGRGNSGFPILRQCIVMNLTAPITTTPPLEGTLAPLTIPTVLL
jgi:hypothetical protein